MESAAAVCCQSHARGRGPSSVLRDRRGVSLGPQTWGEGLVTRNSVRRYLWLLAIAVGLWPPTRAAAQGPGGGTHQVTGRVTRATGEGIPAATVLITGTQRGTQTDNDGYFKLAVPSAPTAVTIRSIGFLPKNVTVGPNDDKVSIALVEDPAKLEQVVVTGLATGVEKRQASPSTVNRSPMPRRRPWTWRSRARSLAHRSRPTRAPQVVASRCRSAA